MANRRLVLYYESSEPPPLSLLQSPYKVLILSFLHPHQDLTLFLNDTPLDQVPPAFWDNVGKLRAGGMQVLFSIGGYRVGDWVNISRNVQAAAEALVPLLATETTQAVDGFDFDWEDWTRIPLPYDATDVITELANFIRMGAFQNVLKSPVLTASPVSGHVDGSPVRRDFPDYLKIMNSVEIDWLNVQFYAGGSPLTASLFKRVVQAGYPAKKIVVGVEAPSDGKFPCGLIKTLPLIQADYPDMGGMFVWNLHRTGPNFAACAHAALNGEGTCADCAGQVRGLIESARRT